MCGIAGVLAPPGGAVDESRLAAMADAMAHRGPDQAGRHHRDGLGVVATRLAIVDLSDAGAQPMVDGDHVLAFNGEIYNHPELRHELAAAGVTFRGHSDTEVVFAALRHHSVVPTLHRLRGMFALAYHDGERLWLARDRFGIKPLVWRRTPAGLGWASEATTLAALAPLEVDVTQALGGFLSLADRSGRRTAFRGVEQVPPGHVLVADPAGHRLERWHDLAGEVDEAAYRELDGAGFPELARRLDQLLTTSVERMLMGDAPTATFLSGGVDSSLLAALAATRADDTHLLLTADVVGPRSEAPAAAAVARLVGRGVTPARFDPGAVLDEWATATRAYEAPLVTHMNSLPYATLARAAQANGVKSVLTGEGADELFFGYAEMAFQPARTLLRAPVLAIERLYERVPGLAKRVLPELSDARERQLAELSEDYERTRLREAALDAYAFAGRHAPRLAAALEMTQGHLLSLLHRNDRMGMAASVESRFPYLDEDLVAFALNLPLAAKLRWTPRSRDRKHPLLRDKAVLRDAAGRHLPTEVTERAKEGFPTVGHEQLRVAPGLFEDGWVAGAVGLSPAGIEHLCHDEAPVVAARLASVEVFGRLFDGHDDPATVTDHLHRHVTVDAP